MLILLKKLSEDNLLFRKMEDPFENLSLDISCEIISKITSLEDIITYRTTSKIFSEISKTCLENVNANVPTYLPIVFFANHPSLKRLGDQIYLQVTPKSLEILTTIPSLRAANLYLGKLATENLQDVILLTLDLLNVERKIPKVNFRIAATTEKGENFFFFLQGRRFMIHSYSDDHSDLAAEIQSRYPELIHFNLEEMYPTLLGFIDPNHPKLLSDRLRRFLNEGNFGLIDPSQPPSSTNPPLSNCAKVLAEAGVADYSNLISLILRYIEINHLREPENRLYWKPDQLINELFHGDFVQAQKEYLESGKTPIDLDNLLSFHITIIGSKNTHVTTENFGEYNIPNWGPGQVMDKERYDKIKQIISQSREYWRFLETARSRGQVVQYYDVTGNLVTL
jgi:hypothetical protein